ncbi:zinc finger HIT domain-containing protein 3 [Oryza brachyantha]|uniref:HIT-type domain-containing protein n=1 Tax=Oryza brachyantha TaxID=4533 RepID=J3L5G9_ORYBR|nr:zinc finger HIT domain-containing protein 3 [Oryza brachyantha]
MAGGSCDVCKEAPSKYKCPACRTPYCSVACFKNHKDKFCLKTVPPEEVSKSTLQGEIPRSSGSLEEGANCSNDKDQVPCLLPDTTCPAQSPKILCSTKALEVEDPSWIVDKNRLRSLVESNEIRDALKDSKLQQMLLKIDGSTEPEKELEKLMEGHAFQQFTNKILDIVSPQQ